MYFRNMNRFLMTTIAILIIVVKTGGDVDGDSNSYPDVEVAAP